MADVLLPVKGPHPRVLPCDAMGYALFGSAIAAYEYGTGTFLLENGQRVSHETAVAEQLEKPSRCRGRSTPALGKYGTCWLGDFSITELRPGSAVLRTTCSTYAVAQHLLKPLKHTVTVRGLRVQYGRRRCLVFPSLTCTGGATALLEEIITAMGAAGLHVHKGAQLLECQGIGGPAVALRGVAAHTRMLLQLCASMDGELTPTVVFHATSVRTAMAHLVAEDYLEGNPWAMPISCSQLRARLGIECAIDRELMFGAFSVYEGCLHLDAPQRAVTSMVYTTDAEAVVLGVRAGRIEPQQDGTYAIPHAHGGYAEVRVSGTGLRELMWQLDALYDACLPLGTHAADLPGCPDALLCERFGGEAYDPVKRTVTSSLE